MVFWDPGVAFGIVNLAQGHGTSSDVRGSIGAYMATRMC